MRVRERLSGFDLARFSTRFRFAASQAFDFSLSFQSQTKNVKRLNVIHCELFKSLLLTKGEQVGIVKICLGIERIKKKGHRTNNKSHISLG